MSAPLGGITPVAIMAFHPEAPAKQGENLDQPNAGIDRESREEAGRRPAGETGVEAAARDPVELRVLSQNHCDGTRENDDGAGEIAENHLVPPPDRERD